MNIRETLARMMMAEDVLKHQAKTMSKAEMIALAAKSHHKIHRVPAAGEKPKPFVKTRTPNMTKDDIRKEKLRAQGKSPFFTNQPKFTNARRGHGSY